MRKVRLYIADMDAGFTASVRALARDRLIEVVGNSDSGCRALREIMRLQPDVLLTDIMLPEYDGISLLRETRRMSHPPAVIICTRFYSAASVDCACRHGASFFFCKPVEPETLRDLILECGNSTGAVSSAAARSDAPSSEEQRCANAVRALLRDLGLSPRLDGSAYILEGMRLLMRNRLLLKNLSQGLYSELAARMNTTVSRIERSLRCAISIAYERGTLSEHFPRRPSNREFIEYVMRAVDESGPSQDAPAVRTTDAC